MTPYKAQVLNNIVELIDRAGERGISKREIAEALGLKVTPHLTSMIDIVANEGHAYCQKDWLDRYGRFRYYAARFQPTLFDLE